MKTILEHDGRGELRVTLVVPRGESLVKALASEPERPWMREVRHLVLVADPFEDNPLQGCVILRDRRKRGEIRLTLRLYEEQEKLEVDHYVQRIGVQRLAGLARDRTPRSRPPPPEAASLRAPPISGSDLLDEYKKQGRPAPTSPPPTKPEGPLAPWLGAQHGLAALLGETTEPEEAACVLAWPVPTLVGRVVVATDFEDLAGAIHAVLFEALGDLPFAVHARSYGGLGKYWHLHTTVVAPPMGDTPMAIELYGRLVAAGAHDFGTRKGAQYLLERERTLDSIHTGKPGDADAHRRLRDLVHGRDLPVPLVIVLESATYANVLYPGPGVPFYM